MATDHDTSFRRLIADLRERARPADGLVLVLVPALLVGVYLLPHQLREALLFVYADPSLRTGFLSTLVHLTPGHLGMNLVMYALFASLVFLFETLTANRRRFYITFVAFLTVFPVILSYSNLAVPRNAVGYGFSGVVMAFAGYLPLTVADYLEDRFGVGPSSAVAPVLFFPTLGMIAVLTLGPLVSADPRFAVGAVGLALAALLAAGLFAVEFYEETTLPKRTVREMIGYAGYCEAAVVGVVVTLAVPFIAFPPDPAAGEGTINLYVHLLGYTLGFGVTYLYTALVVPSTRSGSTARLSR